MATSGPEESKAAIAAVDKLSMLIAQYGKGNPPRLHLDRLTAEYDQSYGKFQTCGLGKLKKFVIKHFRYDEPSQEVCCKARRKKKKKREATVEAEGMELQGTDPSEDNRDSGNGIVSVGAQSAAARSPAADRRAVSVASIPEPFASRWFLFLTISLCLQMLQ